MPQDGKSLFACGPRRRKTKTRGGETAGSKDERGEVRSGFLDQAGLDGLDRDPEALGAAVGQLDADPLEIRAEFALRDAGHVRADAAALLGLALAVDDRALDGAATGDCTDSSHDDFELVKGSEVKGRPAAKQGEFLARATHSRSACNTWNF